MVLRISRVLGLHDSLLVSNSLFSHKDVTLKILCLLTVDFSLRDCKGLMLAVERCHKSTLLKLELETRVVKILSLDLLFLLAVNKTNFSAILVNKCSTQFQISRQAALKINRRTAGFSHSIAAMATA